MGMFETMGAAASSQRKESALRKLERMNRALRHEEPDRVPISDFFWGDFTRRWRKELNLPPDASPYYHYDLDWIATVPNMDPWIRPFETLRETDEEVVVKTGFGAVMRKVFKMWQAMEPERFGAVVNRVGQYYLDCAKAAIDAAGPWLDGFVIWGDVAYKKGTFMRPDYWRTYYKPWVQAIVAYAHSKGLPVIYHGCGNVQAIFEDYIETGIDAFNPLEVKAGMDSVDLRRRCGHRMAFCGTSDIQVWERGDRDEIRREVLRRLNAARGGGLIFQSDHSVTSSVSGHTYDYVVGLVRQYGRYPLNLEECEEAL